MLQGMAPMGGLGGMGNMGGMGMGNMGGMAGMMNNPEMMAQMMQSPIMQNMLNDPEMLRNMLQATPGMSEVTIIRISGACTPNSLRNPCRAFHDIQTPLDCSNLDIQRWAQGGFCTGPGAQSGVQPDAEQS